MIISERGVSLYNDNEAFELLFKGFSISSIGLENNHFNELAKKFDKLSEQSLNVDSCPTVEERAKQWLVDLPNIEVRSYLINLCIDDIEKDRINLEMDLYEERGLIDILKLMIFLVDYFRINKIVWGIGRGSSCSSFVLFKIGVHKINSIRYGLEIKDFLK